MPINGKWLKLGLKRLESCLGFSPIHNTCCDVMDLVWKFPHFTLVWYSGITNPPTDSQQTNQLSVPSTSFPLIGSHVCFAFCHPPVMNVHVITSLILLIGWAVWESMLLIGQSTHRLANKSRVSKCSRGCFAELKCHHQTLGRSVPEIRALLFSHCQLHKQFQFSRFWIWIWIWTSI